MGLPKTSGRAERKKKKKKSASRDFQKQVECLIIQDKAIALFCLGAAIKEVFCLEIHFVKLS